MGSHEGLKILKAMLTKMFFGQSHKGSKYLHEPLVRDHKGHYLSSILLMAIAV